MPGVGSASGSTRCAAKAAPTGSAARTECPRGPTRPATPRARSSPVKPCSLRRLRLLRDRGPIASAGRSPASLPPCSLRRLRLLRDREPVRGVWRAVDLFRTPPKLARGHLNDPRGASSLRRDHVARRQARGPRSDLEGRPTNEAKGRGSSGPTLEERCVAPLTRHRG